ncbi:MAG TPA: hypothetical protein VE911_00625 [Candidatus Nitrosopolaris sp.]|nr:hypothetical protein [Candidatus Nitrosopolaris sp.]
MARRKAKKPKGRARTAKPRKRSGSARPRARKVPARRAAQATVPKRVTELEAENRRLREELAALRARLTADAAPPAEPAAPDEELPFG